VVRSQVELSEVIDYRVALIFTLERLNTDYGPRTTD